VMCFVDDEKVKAGFPGLLSALRTGGQKIGAGEDQLAIEKGVCGGGGDLDGGAAVFVEEGEEKIEAAKKFHEPLVDERFRNEDENPVGSAREVEVMHDEAGLDGFAETDFIGEKDAGSEAGDGFSDAGDLMRNKIDTGSCESASGRLA